MNLLKLENAAVGDILGRSIFNKRGELLLAAGYKLTDDLINKLKDLGYLYIYINNKGTEEVTPQQVIDSVVIHEAGATMKETYEQLSQIGDFDNLNPDEINERLEKSSKFGKKLKIGNIRKVVHDLINEIMESHCMMFSSFPVRDQSSRHHLHSVDVAIISILIGIQYKYSYKELKSLGVAALLHDIGKMPFGDLINVRLKDFNSNALDRELYHKFKEHPVYSMLILKKASPTSFQEQTAVLQHHENYNGTGFPLKLKSSGNPTDAGNKVNGQCIFRFAEIIHTADMYDSLVTGDYDGTIYSPASALRLILDKSGTVINPFLAKAMIRVIDVYPVGTTVRIQANSSKTYIGYKGVISKTNPRAPEKPEIILTHNIFGNQISPKKVNFEEEQFMEIEMM